MKPEESGKSKRQVLELALLGCAMEKPDLISQIKTEWFDDLRISELIELARSMVKAGKPVDSGLLWIKKGGDDTLQLIQSAQEECYSPENFPSWRDDLRQLYAKTKAIHAVNRFMAQVKASDVGIDDALAELTNEVQQTSESYSHDYDSKSLAKHLINSIETKFNLNGKLSGLETGLFDLDRITNGLQFSESSILAARPSIGKTALACNIVSHVCLKNKIPTLFISLEMSADALGRRILSCHQQVNMQSLRSGDLNQGDFDKCAKFTTKLTESPLYVHESLGGMSAGTAAGLIRKYAKRNGVKLVVIDYLQKMKADSKHEKRTYEIAESSGILTGAAKESGVALLLIAQLNREGEKDKGRLPRLSDLADSGQIERDADNVFLLHRKREEPNNASLIVAKQRDGETGLISLFFDGPHCHFQNAVVGPETKVSNDP